MTPTETGTKMPSKTAVIYLRVSTADQATRGGREEGFSIPAQRDANTRKASSLDADVVAEFVDAGESGTKVDKRVGLQQMLAYVAEHPVDYCIVHKLDRLARSRADDVAIHFALKQAGVTLVSTSENIDETPSGMLMHGIMSSIAEFYSRNLANEVTKGLVQKASLGGTVTRAPLGYRNVIRTDDMGRTDRTVEVDTERSHLITWAFLAYADGDYSISALVEELTDRGLTSRPTPRWPAKPLTVPALHKMLRNPYYRGIVVYRGVRYTGAHPPLIDPATWNQVQDRLSANNQAGTNQRRHHHYLKGSVFCGSCGSRLLITNSKNRFGVIYPYFVCAGRHAKRTDCTRAAVLVDTVATLIEREYRTVAIAPEQRDEIESIVHEEFNAMQASAETERHDIDTQRAKLLGQRQKLLDAHYAGAIPLELLKTEQERIGSQLDRIDTRLSLADASFDAARANLVACLNLARDCHAAYMQSDDLNRRVLNQGFFTKIFVDENDSIRFEVAPPFDRLICQTTPEIGVSAPGVTPTERSQIQKARQKSLAGQTPNKPGIAEVSGSHPIPLVELLGRYSNTSEHLKRMKRTLALASKPTMPRPSTSHPFVHKISQRLDPAVLDQLATDYEAGIPTTELTKRYGLGKGTVLRVLMSRGVTMRHQPMSDEQIITAVQLYQSGASLKQIGAELDADHETVRKVLKRAGVQMRKPWER